MGYSLSPEILTILLFHGSNTADQSQDLQNSPVEGNSSRQNFEVFIVLKTSLDFLLAAKKILLFVPSRNRFLLRNYFIDYVSFPTFLFVLIVIIFLEENACVAYSRHVSADKLCKPAQWGALLFLELF